MHAGMPEMTQTVGDVAWMSERGVQLQQHPSGRRPVCIHLGMQRTAISRHQITGGRGGAGTRRQRDTTDRPMD